jgi:hypothetical protein
MEPMQISELWIIVREFPREKLNPWVMLLQDGTQAIPGFTSDAKALAFMRENEAPGGLTVLQVPVGNLIEYLQAAYLSGDVGVILLDPTTLEGDVEGTPIPRFLAAIKSGESPKS